MAKYCMDCGHYIEGGVEHNCESAPKGKSTGRSVCALKEACNDFIDKVEKEKMVFSKIEMKKPRKRKTY